MSTTGFTQQQQTEASPIPFQERRQCPLSNAVRVALELYFRDLEGDAPEGLHAMVMEEVERPLLESVMAHAQGNQTKAARILGINRATLRKKLQYYGL